MPTSTGARFAILLLVGLVVVALPRLWSLVQLTIRLKRDARDKRKARVPDLATAPAYHELLPAEAAAGTVDERTWRDLDLDDVFCRLDFTVSEPGRQYLYHLLRTPQRSAPQLERLDRAVRAIAAEPLEARRLRETLRRLQDPRGAGLAYLFFTELPKRPRLWPVFPVLTIAAVFCLALVPVWPVAGAWWVGVAFCNVVVQVLYKPGLKRYVPALHELPAFLGTSARLADVSVDELAPQREVLREGASRTRALSRAARWLMFEATQVPEEVASLYEYLNLLFLLDVNAFVFTVDTLRASRDRLRAMFEALGFLDAVQALAAWRASRDCWCVPEFTEPRKALRVSDMVHPLLLEPVPNSLIVDGRSVLVSGSNMAGKTTFVRTLGVNAVLAQTLATVCAASYCAPFFEVRTSIGRADSVVEGRSYYLAEVESVLALIRAKDRPGQRLFLLDETFRGTNTTERVAAAFAVLRHLDAGLDIVVVATHDLEVLDLLAEAYAAHHFREQIVDDDLRFDYRLQPGPSSTRNAIALLRFMQYPDAVIDDATAHLNWQSARAHAPGNPPPESR